MPNYGNHETTAERKERITKAMNQTLIEIADSIHGIGKEDLTTAERKIADILVKEHVMHWVKFTYGEVIRRSK